MVPGEFKTEIPCFKANPLLGLTCASNPLGNSIFKPVEIRALSSGFSVIGSEVKALKSAPAAPGV